MCAAEKYLRFDGVLVLRLVADIAGDMAAARILLSMWKRYLEAWHKKTSTSSTISHPTSSTLELSELHEVPCGRDYSKSPANGATPPLTHSPSANSKRGQHTALLLNSEKIAGYPQN